MKLILFPLLNQRSKKAILRTNKKWGHPYVYTPRYILISRLADDLQWSENAIKVQLAKERAFLLEHKYYYSQYL